MRERCARFNAIELARNSSETLNSQFTCELFDTPRNGSFNLSQTEQDSYQNLHGGTFDFI